jgi:hypothetical protein
MDWHPTGKSRLEAACVQFFNGTDPAVEKPLLFCLLNSPDQVPILFLIQIERPE